MNNTPIEIELLKWLLLAVFGCGAICAFAGMCCVAAWLFTRTCEWIAQSWLFLNKLPALIRDIRTMAQENARLRADAERVDFLESFRPDHRDLFRWMDATSGTYRQALDNARMEMLESVELE